MTVRSFASLAALCTVALATGCGGATDATPTVTPPVTPPVQVIALTSVTASPRAGEPLVVQVAGGRVTESSASGTLGGMAIVLGRLTDSTLSGIVPDLPAGRQGLKIQLARGAAEGSLDLQAPRAITDAATTVNTTIDGFAAGLPAQAPPGYSPTEWSAYRKTADSLALDVKTRSAALSPTDRAALARLVLSLDEAVKASADANALFAAGPSAFSAQKVGNMDACGSALTSFYRAGGGFAIVTAALVASIVVTATPGLNAVGAVALAASILAAKRLVPGYGAALVGLASTCILSTDLTASLGSPLVAQGSPPSVKNLHASAAVNVAAATTFSRTAPTIITLTVGSEGISRATIARFPGGTLALAAYDAAVAGFAGLPAAIRSVIGNIPAFPATGAGSKATRPAASSEVRVGTTTPSSVTVTATSSGNSLIVSAKSDDPKEIPFSFPVELIADPTIRTTISAVLPLAAVAVSPKQISLPPNAQQQFAATLGGAPTAAVSWSATGGTITTSGLYTAGTTGGPFKVIARSVVDPSRADSADVSIATDLLTYTLNGVEHRTTNPDARLVNNWFELIITGQLCNAAFVPFIEFPARVGTYTTSDATPPYADLVGPAGSCWEYGTRGSLTVVVTSVSPRIIGTFSGQFYQNIPGVGYGTTPASLSGSFDIGRH